MRTELLLLLSKQQKFKEIEGSDREYRKELIYEGTFEKDGQTFFLGQDDFQVWLSNFEKYTSAGNKVYLQLEHNDNPEATRGEIISLELGKNEDNLPALFGRIKFRDEESEKLAKSAQVSVYVKPEAIDGKGNEYKGGFLAHVALTQSPVIPSLRGFEIAASLVKPKGKSSMIKALAKALEVEGVDETSDENVDFALVLAYVNALKEGEKKDPKDPPKDSESGDPPKDPPADPPKDPEEDDKDKKKMPEMAASFIKRFSNTESKSRKTQIDALVADGRLTKAAADDLKGNFCKPEELALSFDSAGDGGFKDGFDSLVGTLQKNERILSFRESTGHQSASGAGKVSPIVADAEARSK